MEMARKIQGVFSAHLAEYKLVLVPTEELMSNIAQTVQVESFNEKEAGIILGSFQVKEEMEDTLVRWIQRICNLQGSFEIILNNFGGRPTHQVHLRIINPEPVNKFINQLKMIDHFIQSNDCPPADLPDSPQFNILENIPQHSFQKIMEDFASRSFHGILSAETVRLYKKAGTNNFQLSYAFTLPAEAKY